jgi:hypothetical protein
MLLPEGDELKRFNFSIRDGKSVGVSASRGSFVRIVPISGCLPTELQKCQRGEKVTLTIRDRLRRRTVNTF